MQLLQLVSQLNHPPTQCLEYLLMLGQQLMQRRVIPAAAAGAASGCTSAASPARGSQGKTCALFADKVMLK